MVKCQKHAIFQMVFKLPNTRFSDHILAKRRNKVERKIYIMPKRGIINSNQNNITKTESDIKAVFDFLNSLKPNGATRKKIHEKTGFSDSKVLRLLKHLQQEKQPYGGKIYIVKKEGYVYKVVVYDQQGSVIDYGESFKKTPYDNLKNAIIDINALTKKEAIFVNDAVVLYPMKKRARDRIKILLFEYYGTDIKDIIPVDRGLYLILSTDDKNRFNKLKDSLVKLYKESTWI